MQADALFTNLGEHWGVAREMHGWQFAVLLSNFDSVKEPTLERMDLSIRIYRMAFVILVIQVLQGTFQSGDIPELRLGNLVWDLVWWSLSSGYGVKVQNDNDPQDDYTPKVWYIFWEYLDVAMYVFQSSENSQDTLWWNHRTSTYLWALVPEIAFCRPFEECYPGNASICPRSEQGRNNIEWIQQLKNIHGIFLISTAQFQITIWTQWFLKNWTWTENIPKHLHFLSELRCSLWVCGRSFVSSDLSLSGIDASKAVIIDLRGVAGLGRIHVICVVLLKTGMLCGMNIVPFM